MVLSDVDIRRYIAEGKIKIEPELPEDHFGSCSIDFRLGNEFSVFEHSKFPFIDPRDKFAIQGMMRTIVVEDGEPFILQPRDFVLAITMVVAVPVSIGSEQATAQQVAQADAAIAMQTMQLEREKQQLADPKAVDQVIAQAEKAGQIPAGVPEAQKQAQARQFIDTQLKPQLEKQEQQLGQAKLGRDLAVQQRRFGGTARAAVLAIAFAVLALVALL